MSSLFAFLHHLAAFAIVAALVLELVLLRAPLTVWSARRLLVADTIYGASAGLLLAVGLLRVFYFEKGAGYYLNSIPFFIKFGLFVAVGLASIYPTMRFLSWRGALRQNQVPTVAEAEQRRLRAIVHVELVAVVGIILCAVLMARGVGILG
jgi:putative membrane protein